MARIILTGINIQFPISQLIIEGKKTIETRTYPIPENYINQEMALVETPGKSGKFKSRVIAVIKFGPSFQYKNKKVFYTDTPKHCVTSDSIWAWDDKKPKWGWPVKVIVILKNPIPLNKRSGIQYTKNISISY